MSFNFTPARKLALCAVAAAGFAGAGSLTAANAQPGYGPYADQGPYAYQPGPDQSVIIHGRSRRFPPYRESGAPDENVFATRVVYFGDLDLNTPAGAYAYHVRVARAAQAACGQIGRAYPMAVNDTPQCYQAAYRQAIEDGPPTY